MTAAIVIVEDEIGPGVWRGTLQLGQRQLFFSVALPRPQAERDRLDVLLKLALEYVKP